MLSDCGHSLELGLEDDVLAFVDGFGDRRGDDARWSPGDGCQDCVVVCPCDRGLASKPNVSDRLRSILCEDNWSQGQCGSCREDVEFHDFGLQ